MKQESESALSWFKRNEIIFDADKFLVIILNKKESDRKYKPTADNNDNEFTKTLKLKPLGITTDDHLRFD